MIKNDDFKALVNAICHASDQAPLRAVVEKELLHYDMLFALSEHGILDKLTFQGGTALRLCYGLKRFSEDLDFVCGEDFSYDELMTVKSVIEAHLKKRYGLPVTVKEPKQLTGSTETGKVTVLRWKMTLTTRPAQRDIPSQKIRIEIANVPAYSRVLLPIKGNYDVLPDGYADTLLYVESLEEILADKIIAYGARKQIKARDIWDLQWLRQKEIPLNTPWIQHKIKDYGVLDFKQRLTQRTQMLETAVTSTAFHQEMSRFLDRNTIKNKLEKSGFSDYIISDLSGFLNEVLTQIT